MAEEKAKVTQRNSKKSTIKRETIKTKRSAIPGTPFTNMV